MTEKYQTGQNPPTRLLRQVKRRIKMTWFKCKVDLEGKEVRSVIFESSDIIGCKLMLAKLLHEQDGLDETTANEIVESVDFIEITQDEYSDLLIRG